MRVAVATVQVPFILGGAELQVRGLCQALLAAGHEVELVTMPFRFGPRSAVRAAMDGWAAQDFERFDCGAIDRVIALRFPAIYLQHPRKVVWLMHQHRSVYELFGTPFGEDPENPETAAFRDEITARDTEALGAACAVFTTSQEVSRRLHRYNGIESMPLLHPPAMAGRLSPGEAYSYIFCPSRLETLKRQELLVRAMALVKTPVMAVLAGEGARQAALQGLVDELGLRTRVHLVGRVNETTLAAYYRHARAVFFGPYLEDYGYITLEAMLAGRPVITCTDSGGPTQFVIDGVNGHVTEPTPEAVAAAIDALQADPARAARMGEAGLEMYRTLGIGWEPVVGALMAA